MNNLAHSSAFGHRGFSLVELMFSFAILSMILIFSSSIVSQTSQITEFTSRQIKTNKNVGFFVRILEQDLSRIVPMNNDHTVVLFNTDPNKNARIAFLTKSSNLRDKQSRYTAVAYELRDYELVRYDLSIDWNNTQLLDAMAYTVDSKNSNVVAENILRFVLVIKLPDGSLALPESKSLSELGGQVVPNGYTALAYPDVQSIMIGIAAIDDKNIKLPTVPYLGKKLPSMLNPLESPLEVWKSAIEQGALNTFSSPIQNALQLSQKTYDLLPL